MLRNVPKTLSTCVPDFLFNMPAGIELYVTEERSFSTPTPGHVTPTRSPTHGYDLIDLKLPLASSRISANT